MRIFQLIPLTFQILDRPAVRDVHVAGLVLLRDAFARAGFICGDAVAVETIANISRASTALCWGGFEVTDPASGSELRIMGAIGFSANGPAGGTADVAGFSYSWVATPALEAMVDMPEGVRQLLTMRVALQRLTLDELVPYDATTVVPYFAEALAATSFRATPEQATEFVARLAEAMAP